MTNPTSAEDPRIQAALQDYLERRDRGEPIDPEAFLAGHADIADALRSFVAADSAVRRAAGSGSQSAANRTQPLSSQASKTPDDTAISQPRAATSVDLPPTFGRYKIVRTLGRGAMGTVYLAEDTQLQRPVALKTAVFDSDPSGELLERFYREARSAATLRHPHICPVYDVDQIDGRHFLTMAYIDGRPLSAYVQAGKAMSEKDALTVVRKLALALQEAHDHGIIHRDLKPGNVMIDSKGEPIITDFGLARRVGQSDQARITQSGMIIGSPAYMSPEQVDGEPDRLTGAADQYSLGVILFELLTGQIPFRGTVSSILGSILTKAPPKPSSLRPGLDPRIEALCLRMMAKRPEQRFADLKAAAAEAATILKSPAAGAGDAPKAAGGPKPAARATDAAAKASTAGATASKAARRTVVEMSISEGNVAALAATAKKLVSRRDYDEAIRMLEQIPENRRSDEVRALLDKARRLADEVMFLLTEIDEAVRKNDADTAVRKADDLLKIKPGHHRAKEIQEQYGAYGEGGATRGLRRGRHGGGIVGEEGWNLWIALAFGLLVFGVALWGVTAYLKVGDAVVKVTINDPDITVSLKGHTLSIAGTKEPVKVTPGDGSLKITYGDLDFQSNTFTLKKGDNPVVTIERLDDRLAAKFGDESLGEWKVPAKPKNGATTTGTTAPGTGWHGWLADAPKAAVAPFDATQAKKHQDEWAKYLNVPVEYTNTIGMKFRLIPPGEFLMGSTPEEIAETIKQIDPNAEDRQQGVKSEAPRHRVILTRPIYLGVMEVTQSQYEKVIGRNPSFFAKTGTLKEYAEKVEGRDTSMHPVEGVTWSDALEFCAKLSQQEKLKPFAFRPGEVVVPHGETGYRLPTEAEWEFACRAGTATRFWIGDAENELMQAGWINNNSDGRTHAAGELKANPFGLHDVHGNVWEWVQDDWGLNTYSQFQETPAVDPVAPTSAGSRLIRGGDWGNSAFQCRSSNRVGSDPTGPSIFLGFRASLTADAVRQALKVQGPAIPGSSGTPSVAPKSAVAPFDAAGAKALQDAWARHLGVPVERTNSIGMKFRLIPPGDYVVGATDAEIAADLAKVKGDGVWEQRIRSSGPRHTVRLTKPYYMGVYEVTQKEFETVMGRNPSYLSPTGAGKALVQGRDTGDDPVEYLTWGDAADFCRKLNEREKLSSSYAGAGDALQIVAGEGYRLPTEAEWEAACRAGTTTKYWFGDDEAASDQAAWTTRNAGNLVHKAGQLKANPFGLHDVHGNVWEWCHDFYNPNEYAAFAAQPAVDPTGPSAANPPHRVFRGGGMTFDPSKHHSALRVANAPTAIDHAIGFRVLLPVTAKPAQP